MNDNELAISSVCDSLGAGAPVVLVSIVSSEGTLPRHAGSKLIVRSGGRTAGTIGGGLMEAAAIKLADAALQDQRSRWMEAQLEGEDAASEEPVCGGTATLLVDFIPASKENADFFRRYRDHLAAGRDLYSVTVLRDEADLTDVVGRSLLMRDGTLETTFAWPPQDLQQLRSELHDVSSTAFLSLAGKRVVVESVNRAKTVYCFGAGHVAVPTARLSAQTGFVVNVLDDRADFASRDRFPDADGVFVIEGFDHALDGLSIDEDSFIVIFTRGHRHDETVLEQALRTNAAYIGMIGSRRKRDMLFAALRARGVSQAQIDRVHSPIGLPIQAETPEEIAVSIVAELIQERARQRK